MEEILFFLQATLPCQIFERKHCKHSPCIDDMGPCMGEKFCELRCPFPFEYKFPFKYKSKNKRKLYTRKKSLQPAPRHTKLPPVFLTDAFVTHFWQHDLPSPFQTLQGMILPEVLSQDLTLLCVASPCPVSLQYPIGPSAAVPRPLNQIISSLLHLSLKIVLKYLYQCGTLSN